MACAYWRTDHTVGSLLEEREVGWEFLQLVKLLLLASETKGNSNERDILKSLSESIAFRASLASDFPPSEVRKVEQREGQKTQVSLVNDVVSAINGPLPEPFFAWVKEQAGRGDYAMADFLDIFNHRLASLKYLVARNTRPNLGDRSVDNSETGDLLAALSGVVFNRQAKASDFLLSGLLANRRMSYPVAKELLWFEMGIRLSDMHPYQGGWVSVDEDDHSRLGQATCELGTNATLGNSVWDQHKAVEWVIAPLPWAKIQSLIPGGKDYQRFGLLLARISDGRCDSHIVLKIKRDDIPLIQLGEASEEVELVYDKSSSSNQLALGLTTVLSKHKPQNEGQALREVKFTIETSNPAVVAAMANDYKTGEAP